MDSLYRLMVGTAPVARTFEAALVPKLLATAIQGRIEAGASTAVRATSWVEEYVVPPEVSTYAALHPGTDLSSTCEFLKLYGFNHAVRIARQTSLAVDRKRPSQLTMIQDPVLLSAYGWKELYPRYVIAATTVWEYWLNNKARVLY